MTTSAARRRLGMLATTALLGGGLSLTAVPANAATLDVCASGCTYSTIQSAVNAAAPGDTVTIAAGTYSGAVSVPKGITLQGAGAGEDPGSATIIEGGGTGNGLTLNPATGSLVVRDLRVTGFSNGIVVSSNVVLERVASHSNANYGINVNSGTSDLTIRDSTFNNNSVGFKLGSTASASAITIEGSSFDGNSNTGWYSDKASASTSTLTGLSITDSTFNDNAMKGFYTEKLSDAVFTRVEFIGSGNERDTQGTGLDINLKYGDYENISLVDLVVVDSGQGPSGQGISIAARDDAPNYNSKPATVANVSIKGGVVTGAVTGISLVFAITTEAEVHGVDLSGNDVALSNGTPSLVDASLNYWGSASPDFEHVVVGDAVTSPWFVDAEMTAVAVPVVPGEPVQIPNDGHAVEITIPAEMDEPVLDVSALTDEDGVITVEDGLTVINEQGPSLEIPAGTTITPSDPEWGTEFLAPQFVSLTEVELPDGEDAEVVVAVKVGSDDVSFVLDRAARLVLPGAAGSSVGFIEPGGEFTEITEQCADDSQAAGDAVDRDCAIVVGDDLVVWTKHFTVFAAYVSDGPAPGPTPTPGPRLANTGIDATPVWIAGGLLTLLGAAALIAMRRRKASVR